MTKFIDATRWEARRICYLLLRILIRTDRPLLALIEYNLPVDVNAKDITYKLRIFRLCQWQFRVFFRQILGNFAEDASQICVAAANFMAKVGVTSMFGAFRYKKYHLDRNSDCLTCN
jgi:hypothetical protein